MRYKADNREHKIKKIMEVRINNKLEAVLVEPTLKATGVDIETLNGLIYQHVRTVINEMKKQDIEKVENPVKATEIISYSQLTNLRANESIPESTRENRIRTVNRNDNRTEKRNTIG